MRGVTEYQVLRWEATEDELRDGLRPQQFGYARDIDRVIMRTIDGRLRYFVPDPEWDEAMKRVPGAD